MPNPANNNIVFTAVNKAQPMIETSLKSGVVPMLHGSPAIGKSSLAQMIADKWNLLLLDERLTTYDAGEINGLMNFTEDRMRTKFIPMENFPLDTDTIPINPKTKQPYNGWLLFLDELPSAARPVMAAAYKLILDRAVGRRKLHPKVMMMAAGNLDTDNAIVNSMGTALKSRMVNYYLKPDLTSWLAYMQQAGRLDFRIAAFLEYKKDLFFNFDPEATDDTFGSPRTYEMLSRQIKHIPNVGFDILALVTGTIGAAAGREFVAFCEYFDKLPSMKEIVANPTHTRIPTELSFKFALAGKLGNETTLQNSNEAFEFMQRMDPEFQFIAVRAMVAKANSNPKNTDSPIGSAAQTKWSVEFSKGLW